MAHKLLDAVTATGVSEPQKVSRLAYVHSVQINITGAPSAVTVDLEGSLDGVNFAQYASHEFSAGELTDTFAIFHVVDKLLRYARLRLVTLTGGTAPTVSAFYEPFIES